VLFFAETWREKMKLIDFIRYIRPIIKENEAFLRGITSPVQWNWVFEKD